MMPSGPPTAAGGAQSAPPALLRSNSAFLGGGQPGSMASQQQYSPLVSPRTQFSGNNNGGSMSMLGNIPNVSSLLNQSFANGAPGPGGGRAGSDMLGSGEADPMSFSSSSAAAQGQHFQNPSAAQDYAQRQQHFQNTSAAQDYASSGAAQRQHFQNTSAAQDYASSGAAQRQHFQNISAAQDYASAGAAQRQHFQNTSAAQDYASSGAAQRQHFQNTSAAQDYGSSGAPQRQHFQNTSAAQDYGSSGAAQRQHFQNTSAAQDYASQSQQMEGFQQLAGSHNPQLRGGYGNAGSMGPVKMEQQSGAADQSSPLQQLQSMRSLGGVKLDPQQLQSVRSLGPMKLERQLSDSSMFLQQQQQQQQYLQLSRHSTQAAAAQINMLRQQRLMQLQHQQQQQILKTMPQQRNQLLQQQLQQGLPVRPQGKPTMYEPGMCARRLTHYMYQQQQRRPEDNNIHFWRSFVAEFFAPNAKKRWCVSLYGSGRQTTGVFPQDIWHCEICKRKPGRGFETTVEVLPRLFQIKYASGTLEELLYVDMPCEYQNASGQIVLDYNKAIQESVFDQLRVVREGQLRIVFSPELKISSWEFCARRHEELIPRCLLIPQVSQLGAVVQKYQQATSNASAALSAQDMQNFSNSFVASARQIAKTLEVPLVNDLGYTKRYVRCLQISEVVNSMKDLIDYSRETGTGPMDSLINFPRRSSGPQPMPQSQNQNGQNPVHASGMQLSSASTGVTSLNSSLHIPSTTSLSSTSLTGLLHQNSMNSRQENHMSNASNSYCSGNTVQIPSASSSNALLQAQPNTSSPFPSPTPSTSNSIPTPTSHGNPNLNSSNSPMSGMQQQTTQPLETDPSDSQSSVQQILQEIMMSPQMNGASSLGNEMMGMRGGNGTSVAGMGFGGMGSSANANGLRAAMTNNIMSMNGRVGVNHIPHDPMSMSHHQQQDMENRLVMSQQHQDMENRLLSGLGSSSNSFSNFQFDWKPSP